jgi:hypothetical protein
MSVIEIIDVNGQIFLSTDYVGKSVMVDEIEPGVWVVKVGQFIPDNERWLHEAVAKAKLDEAIAWAETTPVRDNLLETTR